MKQEIKSKWHSEKYGIAVTENREVIRLSDMVVLQKEYSYNRIVFRANCESSKIGMKSLSASLIKKEIVIQSYCPF